MAGTSRVVFGDRSRAKNTKVGVQVNLFGFTKLHAGINGEALASILMSVGTPSLEVAKVQWPFITGASRDSIELVVSEIAERRARVLLQAGGQTLIDDPRNKSHKDYAPFIEFNGTATAPAGILRNAIYDRDSEIREGIRKGIATLVEELTR